MINYAFFAERLKCLKTTHELSNSQLAILLGFKSRGTISGLLSGKTTPLFANLTQIADIFAVSLDWITGRSDTPYSDEILFNLEHIFLKTFYWNINLKNKIFFYLPFPPNNYLDPTKRANHYSLPIRANIIFLFNIFMVVANFEDAKKDADFAEILSSFDYHELSSMVVDKKKGLTVADLLNKLFSGEINKPIFDITKQP